MTVDSFLRLRDPRSRRDFFRLAGVTTVGGSAVFLAACGDDDDDPDIDGAAAADVEQDITTLNAALDLEFTAVAAYTAGAALLRGDVLEVGTQFRDQEQEHADGIKQAILDLGGTPNEPKSEDAYKSGFPALASQKDVLEFAVDLETMAVQAYIDALPKLSTGELRGTAASIVTNEAEHISVLLGALGKDPVPEAFVTGIA